MKIIWMSITLFVFALNKIRIGPVTAPEYEMRFGPQQKLLKCQQKDETESWFQLAFQARWAMLLRQCKSMTTGGWNYLLCFGGRFERFFPRGQIRQELGNHNKKLDGYVNEGEKSYFVQHYVNGTKYDDNTMFSSEVRCYCGEGEPKLESLTMTNETNLLVNLEMFSCCKRVTVPLLLSSMPPVLSFNAQAGDHRFPGGSMQGMEFRFRNNSLVIDSGYDSEKTFKMKPARFVARLPNLVIYPLVSRPTLRAGARSAIYWPLEGAVGGIYGLCHTYWDEIVGDTYLDLIHAQIHQSGDEPEVYVLYQSLALCGMHQLIPKQRPDTVVQCGEVEVKEQKEAVAQEL